MPRLALVLALLVFVDPSFAPDGAGASDPCTLCTGTKEVKCVTCSGRGRASASCPLCRGQGRSTCQSCKLDAKDRAALKLKLGWIPCPNPHCDKKGVVTWESGDKDGCKVCDGRGIIKCPTCTDGMAPCILCASKGQLEGTCGDCAGSGRLPCAACAANAKARSCPLCHNDKVRACELCKPGGSRPPETGATVRCEACAGTGSKPCQECSAFGKLPCRGCGGTGMIRSKIMGTGEKAGKKTDANCKGSGWVKCELCKSGKVDCGKCKGGSRSVTCSGCRDAKTVKCRGCSFGRWRAFETCGRVLHAASRFDDAAAYYATALRLVTEYTIDASAEPAVKKLQQDWIGENRSRVEAEIAAAEAKLPPPAAK